MMEELLPQNIVLGTFNELQIYDSYVREFYKSMDKKRFESIPLDVNKRNPRSLTKDELLDLDKWVQKRGTPLDMKIHLCNRNNIEDNSKELVQSTTIFAFQKYLREDPIPALKILTDYLKGVGPARASLLLSVAEKDDVPFFSDELYCWMNWSRGGWKQKITWSAANYRILLQQVRALRDRLGPDVTATQVEQVAYVLKKESSIQDVKSEEAWKPPRGSPELGKGSHGTVYKVPGRTTEPDGTKTTVAVKSVLKSSISDYNRFNAEVTYSMDLEKALPERFVKLIGWSEDDDFMYIAMDLVPHGNLTKALVEPEWNMAETKATAKLEGLNVMHKAGIAHRDLKPDNILISHAAPEVQIKLADFGVSKRISNRGTSDLRTKAGTVKYRAPEVRLEGKYTFKVDLWSLGSVIFTMVNGKSPFNDELEIARRSEDGTMTNVASTLIGVSEAGVTFVRRLLEPDPKNRPDASTALEDPWFDEPFGVA